MRRHEGLEQFHPKRKRSQLVLWDLDGTLCPHNAAFFRLAPEAVAYAALSFGIPVSAAEAVDYARQNFRGQRVCVRAFATRFNLDEDALFARYYERLSPDFLDCPAETLQAFRHSTRFLSHGVLTHAPESWAYRALDTLGLRDVFDPASIWGHQHLNGCHKTEDAGRNAVRTLLQQGGWHPRQVTLVDDKLAVLEALRPCADTLIRICPESTCALPGIRTAASPRDALAFLDPRANPDWMESRFPSKTTHLRSDKGLERFHPKWKRSK